MESNFPETQQSITPTPARVTFPLRTFPAIKDKKKGNSKYQTLTTRNKEFEKIS